MRPLLRALFALITLVVATGVAWRLAGRQRSLPCPAWLDGLLENPYVEAVAGSQTLLDRAGLAPGMRVLDAGCGPGRLTIPLAERIGPEGEVVALDIQPAMLDRLNERVRTRGLTNVRPVLDGLGEGLLEGDAFDRAFLVTVLGEVPDRERALREIHAALKPGGVLSVTEMLPDPHYQSQDAVRRLAVVCGFRIDRTFGSVLAYTLNLVKEPATGHAR